MLSGSAILRVILLLVTAAILTGLVRYYWVHDGSLSETPRVTAPSGVPNVARSEPPRQQRQAKAPEPPPAPIREPEPATPEPALEQPPIQEAPAMIQAAPEQPGPQGEQGVELAQRNEGAPAIDLVDLNTGSLAQLNGLKGGGAIGRAIIQHRPYTSVDQLLSKRVLSRGTYQRIKDQVSAR